MTPDVRRAFTLLECLVAIAVVAILSAILIPVVSRARERATLSRCLSNLRQVSAAVMAYTADQNEIYPLSRMRASEGCDPRMDHWTWKRAIVPYVKSPDVFRCPKVRNYWAACPEVPGAFGDESNIRREFLTDGSRASWLPASYAFSDGFFHPTPREGRPTVRHTSDMEDPSSTLLLLNTRTGSPGVGPWAMRTSGINPRTGAKDATFVHRSGLFVAHSGRIPFVMADGHVQALTLRQTVDPKDRWGSRDPEWDGRTTSGRDNLLSAAQYAMREVAEYR